MLVLVGARGVEPLVECTSDVFCVCDDLASRPPGGEQLLRHAQDVLFGSFDCEAQHYVTGSTDSPTPMRFLSASKRELVIFKAHSHSQYAGITNLSYVANMLGEQFPDMLGR